MIDDFLDFMIDTVVIEPVTNRDSDGYGTPTYGPPVSYQCKLDGTMKKVVDVNGLERVSMARIYLPGRPVISVLDRLTMPAGYSPTQPPILAIGIFEDELGDHHIRISV